MMFMMKVMVVGSTTTISSHHFRFESSGFHLIDKVESVQIQLFVVELISSRAVKYNKQNGSPTDLVDLTPLEMSWTATIDSRMKVIFMIDQSER